MKIVRLSAISETLVPELALFQSLKDRRLAAQQLMIIDSPKLILRLYRAGGSASHILCDEAFFQGQQSLLAKDSGSTVYVATRPMMQAIVGHRLHHGAIALTKRPPSCELQDLGPRIVVLDRINKAENCGAIVRTCAAFGIDSILFDGTGVAPHSRRAARVSMGSIFHLKSRRSDDLAADLQTLKNMGYQITVAHQAADATPYRTLNWTRKQALVIGSEGFGPRPAIIELASQTVEIPIAAAVDSLNASIAAAILISEWTAQAE